MVCLLNHHILTVLIKILDEIRVGTVSDETEHLLNTLKDDPVLPEGILPTEL